MDLSGEVVFPSGRSAHPFGGVCVVGELAATGLAGGAVLRRSGWFAPDLISAGVSGRCCHCVTRLCYESEGLVLELSLIFCATGINGVQLRSFLGLSMARRVTL